MTKEEQIELFGMEVPDRLIGYLKDRIPTWDKEYIKKVVESAQLELNRPCTDIVS